MLRFAAAIVLLFSSLHGADLFTVEDALDVRNVSPMDLSNDGRWLVARSASLRDRIGIDNKRFGDPTYIAPQKMDVWVIDTRSGAAEKLFADRRQVRGAQWSPDGSRLAIAVLEGDRFVPVIWERATKKVEPVALSTGKMIADGELQWSADGSKLLLPLRTVDSWKKSREQFVKETEGTVVVHSTKEPFLAWDELRRTTLVRSIAVYDWRSKQTTELLAEGKLNGYELTDDGAAIVYQPDISKKTDYDVIFGRESELRTMPISGGESKLVLKSTKGLTLIWSQGRRHYAYAKDGVVYRGSIDEKESKALLGKKEEKKEGGEESEADKEKRAKERFTPVSLSPDGSKLIVSNKEGLWIVDAASTARDLIVKTPEEDKLSPRYSAIGWKPDSSAAFFSYSSRKQWERGLMRYDVASKQIAEVFKDGRIFTNPQFSKDGSTMIVSVAEGNRPADLFSATADFKSLKRLTDANPQIKTKQLGKTELVSYLDVDGRRLHGVLYYPAVYEPGKKYPLVVNVYEQFFDDTFQSTISVLNANGYAVLQPSVEFETGFPGEAWLKGVTAAVNKVIEMGVADPERLGLQGTSYGGYATNLLITQTNRFKAAINISGKVNMVSFYTDSPRLGVRNIHAPEKSQDRIGATLWQQPQKYLEHSAILYADRIKTPLLLMTGEQDHNVPPRQAMEMYYALRRLGKTVAWVSYTNGGHGMPTSTVEEVKDYHQRILDWYAEHLAPKKKDEVPATGGQ
jgi:dipeptidyl aminopeptidase/acylaminoacyl peptidase